MVHDFHNIRNFDEGKLFEQAFTGQVLLLHIDYGTAPRAAHRIREADCGPCEGTRWWQPSSDPCRTVQPRNGGCRIHSCIANSMLSLCLGSVQHYVDGFGAIEMPQIGYRMCPTLHLPSSVVPAFQAARFDYDDMYREFAKKFGLKLVLLLYHHDIPGQHAGGLLETQAAGWTAGPLVVDATVSVIGYDSQSYSEADLFTAGFVQSRPRQLKQGKGEGKEEPGDDDEDMNDQTQLLQRLEEVQNR